MLILDGKGTSAELRSEMAREVSASLQRGVRAPGLAVVLVGDDAASHTYVRNKQRACDEVGIQSLPFFLPAQTGQAELLALIRVLNSREDVDGILLQLPLPPGLDTIECLWAIDPAKDVDGFHPINAGKLALDLPGFVPCTPAGVMELLKRYGLSVAGKNAVVVGRSDIVGKPLARLLSSRSVNATVTICHSATADLKAACRNADFLFLAMGKPRVINGDMIKEGCVVVDIGINHCENGLCGDADFESVSAKAGAISPVPGGVGPMTIAMLLRNTLLSWKRRTGQAEVAPNADGRN